MNPTITMRRPVDRSASTIRSAASAEVASGFSHSTGLPDSMQASANGSWVKAGEAITTASTLAAPISSSPSLKAVAPTSSASRTARSCCVSAIATTSAPETDAARVRAWIVPISPAPMTPTFIGQPPQRDA